MSLALTQPTPFRRRRSDASKNGALKFTLGRRLGKAPHEVDAAAGGPGPGDYEDANVLGGKQVTRRSTVAARLGRGAAERPAINMTEVKGVHAGADKVISPQKGVRELRMTSHSHVGVPGPGSYEIGHAAVRRGAGTGTDPKRLAAARRARVKRTYH